MSEEITITSIQPAKKVGRPRGSKNKPAQQVKVSAVEAPKVERSYAISVSEDHHKIIEGMHACSGMPRSAILGLMIDQFVKSTLKA